MPLFIFARFEPKPGKERELKEELERVLEPTRQEPGCIRIHLYLDSRQPQTFFIHSEWVDEQAFEAHGEMPHTLRLAAVASNLIANPFRAFRTECIG